MLSECDILVVGAGPAGMAAAGRLARAGNRRVTLIDSGSDLAQRRCPALRNKGCAPCRRCDLLQGVGGASGIVGGKFCYFPAGSRIADHVEMTCDEANEAILAFMSEIGFPAPKLNKVALNNDLAAQLLDEGIEFRPYCATPVLANELYSMFCAMKSYAINSGVSLRCNTEMRYIEKCDNGFKVEIVNSGRSQMVSVRTAVILATGRSTSTWLAKMLSSVGAVHGPISVDVGVRIECDSDRISRIFAQTDDPKLVCNRGLNNEIRTLCWCRGGALTVTSMEGFRLIDGHFGPELSRRTSVSIVARRPVPLSQQPLSYAAALMGHCRGCSPQTLRLDEFMGQSTVVHVPCPQFGSPCETERLALPKIENSLLNELRVFIRSLSNVTGGALLTDESANVYSPVIDHQWSVPQLDQGLQTNIPGLFLAGDIQGQGRGILQAMFTGLVVADAISKRPANRHVDAYERYYAHSVERRRAALTFHVPPSSQTPSCVVPRTRR